MYTVFKMPKKCFFGCSPSETPVHRFPSAEMFPERFHAWVNIVGGKLETQSDFEFYQKKIICNKHFSAKDYNRFKRLNALAVPSLLTGSNPSEHEVIEEPEASTSRIVDQLQILTENPQIDAEAVVIEHSYSVISRSLKQHEKCATRTVSYRTRTWKPSEKKIKNLRSEVCRLRKKASTFKQRLCNAEKLSNDKLFNQTVKNMTKPAQLFVHMQLQATKHPKGRRFSIDEKVLALSLFKKSPKCYSLLYKYFTLPSVKAMKRLLAEIRLSPGINPIIFEKIKKTVDEKDVNDRLCSLMFDEMSLTPQVSYNSYKDTLEGFAFNNNNFADHALLFMVKGIKNSFKQPIAYYFTNSLKKLELKSVIKEVIQYAQKSGLIIINTVCDQSTVNVGAITDLVNDSKTAFLRLGKEWRYDFFSVNGKKIIPIYDAPHLIKGIRNNLITKDMAYTTNNVQKIVKWDYFQMVYAADKSYGELRLLNKITEEHIVPEKINKMKVKSATQLFSHSVAVATEHLTARGDLPNECRSLIEITLLIDNLFDSLNSNTFNIPNGKIFKGPIRKNSPHHELWRKAKCIIKSIKFISKKNESNKIRLIETVIPSVINLIKTIEGMEAIWKVLNQKYGLDVMLTRNFNQDPVENFFGSIRSYGVRNIAPNSTGFESAFKALLLNNFSYTHSSHANCEEDKSNCLENLKFFLTEKPVSSDVPDDHVQLNNEVLVENIEKTDAGQVNYVCGWVIKKLLKTVVKNCKTCRETILDHNDQNSGNDFIKAKEYHKKKWLVYPHEQISNCFHDLQSIITGFLKKNVPRNNIKCNILMLMDVLVDNPFNCEVHKDVLLQQFKKLSINMIIYSWCRSINRILSGKLVYSSDDDETKKSAQLYHNKFKHLKNRK